MPAPSMRNHVCTQTKEKNKNPLSGMEAVVLDWKELSHETMGCNRAEQFLVSVVNEMLHIKK